MKTEEKKYAKILCEEHHETALTRDDARKSAGITIKHVQKIITQEIKNPDNSPEKIKRWGEKRKFYKSVNSFINEWDPYK